MKIGIDLRSLQVGHEFRGIGTYVRSIVNELSRLPEFRQHQIIFYYYDTTNPIDLLNLDAGFTYDSVVFKNPKQAEFSKPRKAVAYFHEVQQNNLAFSPVPQTAGLDIFLQFDQALGLPRSPRIKTILVVHDLIPLVFKPYFLPSAWRMLAKENWKSALKTLGSNTRYSMGVSTIKRADHIIAVSQHTKRCVEEMLGIKPSKVTVVHEGGVHEVWKTAVDLRQKTKKPVATNKKVVDKLIEESKDVPYLFFLGGVEPPRRRLDDLIAALYHLRAEGHKFRLVLGGKELADKKNIPNAEVVKLLKHISYTDDVYCLGFIDDADVSRLYSHAFAFVFPSLYEGFGLPVLEAMAHKCPVISYDNSSIPEIAEGAAVLIDPTFDAIKEAVLDLHKHPEHRQELIEAGEKRAAKFTWKRSAEGVLDVLHKVK